MRRINKRNTLDKLSKEIILISSIFIVFVIIGSLLNKIFPQYTDIINENIAYTANYYEGNVSIGDVVLSNFKQDFLILFLMATCTTSIILSPVALVIFLVKGLSIGYTINSFIIAMKFGSIKLIFITLIKFLILLPGMIVLALISIKYFSEMIGEIKKKNKINYKYFVKRYLINSSIIITITILGQAILNTIYVATLQIF